MGILYKNAFTVWNIYWTTEIDGEMMFRYSCLEYRNDWCLYDSIGLCWTILHAVGNFQVLCADFFQLYWGFILKFVSLGCCYLSLEENDWMPGNFWIITKRNWNIKFCTILDFLVLHSDFNEWVLNYSVVW